MSYHLAKIEERDGGGHIVNPVLLVSVQYIRKFTARENVEWCSTEPWSIPREDCTKWKELSNSVCLTIHLKKRRENRAGKLASSRKRLYFLPCLWSDVGAFVLASVFSGKECIFFSFFIFNKFLCPHCSTQFFFHNWKWEPTPTILAVEIFILMLELCFSYFANFV